jgi:hypothetical protein
MPPLAKRAAGLAAGVLLTAVLVHAAGCGGPQPYGEVEGAVTLDGRPLANVEVVFLPDPERGNTGRRSTALTDAQGRYRLASDAGRGGAPVGFHRVCINDLLAGPADPLAQPRQPAQPRFPREYGSALSTPLRDVEVKPGRQVLDLKVKSELPP